LQIEEQVTPIPAPFPTYPLRTFITSQTTALLLTYVYACRSLVYYLSKSKFLVLLVQSESQVSLPRIVCGWRDILRVRVRVGVMVRGYCEGCFRV